MSTIPLDDGVKIPISRSRIFLLWLLAIAFVAAGFFLLSVNPIVGLLSIGFFGLGVLFFPVMAFHEASGLYITSKGINAISPFVKDSFVAWNEIEGFGLIEVRRNKLLSVYLKDPEAYLQRLSRWQQWLGKMSSGISGTPYSLSPSIFGCSFEELSDYINSEFKKHIEV